MSKKTLAQKILGIEEIYADYDFAMRKKRRTILVEAFIPREMEVCKRNLIDVKELLDDLHIDFWLMYGTLLGVVRDKAFIEHDTDIDIGLYDENKYLMERVVLALKEKGFELIRTNYDDNIVTVIRNDEYVDFMFYKRDNLPFKNFKKQSFLGTKFMIPENSEQLFRDWYGEEWKLPVREKHATLFYGLDEYDYSADYWREYYYKKHTVQKNPSSFAEFCMGFINKDSSLLDIGCGNGRDSLYFSKEDLTVTGIDIMDACSGNTEESNVSFVSVDLLDKNKCFGLKNKFNVVYCRFMLHTFTEDTEKYILNESYEILNKKGLLCIETRSDKGIISPHIPKHYRRLINLDVLIGHLNDNGFEILYKTERSGLSPIDTEDPILIRIICRKP